MVNTQRLHDAVNHFVFQTVTKGNSSSPCTKGDLDNAVKNLAKVLEQFIAELENVR